MEDDDPYPAWFTRGMKHLASWIEARCERFEIDPWELITSLIVAFVLFSALFCLVVAAY
jgi:hypothetical protein